MFSDSNAVAFLRLINNTKVSPLYTHLFIIILLFIFLLTASPVQATTQKSYLRIEQNKSSYDDDPLIESDLKITSVGGLIFDKDMEAHVDLSYLESEKNGKGLTLDFGAGYVFSWDVSLFLGLGISLGYNKDNEDLIATYYPEAGIVLDITNTLGITVSKKRIFNLYDRDEDIIMLGLVFR